MKNIIFIIAAVLLFAAAMFAQGSVEGTITDAKGNGIGGVSVTVVGANGKPVATATTGGDGAYTFDEIAAGKYKIAVYGAKGYAAAFRDDVVVTKDDTITLNIALTAAAASPVQKPPVKPVTPPVKPAVPAITLDEIINRHINALGGREKLSSLKTLRMTGAMLIAGIDAELTMTHSHLIGMRMDITLGQTDNYEIYTPTRGLVYMPIRRFYEEGPEEMPADQLNGGQALLDIQSPLLDFKSKGTTVEFLGKELGTELNDHEDNFKLRLSFRNGKVSTYFISSKTYFITKKVSAPAITDQQYDTEIYCSDYRKNADGYWFAYFIRTNTNSGITYRKIETNIALDPKIFSPPR